LNVKAVINLQELGEHPNCGDGIDPLIGFSYNPEILNSNGIVHYNFAWEDWKVPTIKVMLNIVKVIDAVIIERGRILVHCHAGMGRTGLVIGCYMLYSGEYEDLEEVISAIKEKRNKAFSTKLHNEFIRIFNDLLKGLKILFPAKTKEKLSLKEHLTKQNYLLHGPKKRQLKNSPILLSEISERIHTLRNKDIIKPEDIVLAIIGRTKDSNEVNLEIKELKQELNKWNWKFLYNCKSPIVLIQLALDFLDDLSVPIIEHVPEDIKSLSLHQKKVLGNLTKLLQSNPQEKNVEGKEYKGALYRLAISLLGLRDKEAKCFLDRELIDWDFSNVTLIESVKNCIESTMDTKITHKITSDSNSSNISSPIRPELGFSKYSQFIMNLEKLPKESPYLWRFEKLVKDLEENDNTHNGSELLLPETVLKTDLPSPSM